MLAWMIHEPDQHTFDLSDNGPRPRSLEPAVNLPLPIARLLCCAVLTFAAATSRADSGDRDALARLLDEFMAGASRNDPAVHDRFWAEDLVYTSSSGERFGKAAIMSGFETPAGATVPELRYSAADVDIRVYGDSAVIAFRLLGESSDDTRPVQQFFNTGTFLKRGGEWRAVAWQATRIPAAPSPPTD